MDPSPHWESKDALEVFSPHSVDCKLVSVSALWLEMWHESWKSHLNEKCSRKLASGYNGAHNGNSLVGFGARKISLFIVQKRAPARINISDTKFHLIYFCQLLLNYDDASFFRLILFRLWHNRNEHIELQLHVVTRSHNFIIQTLVSGTSGSMQKWDSLEIEITNWKFAF